MMFYPVRPGFARLRPLLWPNVLILEDIVRHYPTLKFAPIAEWAELLYWITTFFCNVFTPPLEFCAVTVITLSPGASEGVK